MGRMDAAASPPHFDRVPGAVTFSIQVRCFPIFTVWDAACPAFRVLRALMGSYPCIACVTREGHYAPCAWHVARVACAKRYSWTHL